MNLNKQAGPRAADSEIDSEQSRNVILSSLRSADGIADYMSLCRKWRDLEHARSDTGTEPLRIALLSGATTDFLELPLRAELASLGLRADIHRCDFNTHVSALLESDSTTAAFRPNVAVVLLDLSDISEWPTAGDDETAVSDCADSFAGRWLGLCEAFHNNTGAEIILGNLRLPTTSPNGHLSRQLPWDRTNFVRRINQLLADKAPRFVHTLDIEALSAQYGLKPGSIRGSGIMPSNRFRLIVSYLWFAIRQASSLRSMARRRNVSSSISTTRFGAASWEMTVLMASASVRVGQKARLFRPFKTTCCN